MDGELFAYIVLFIGALIYLGFRRGRKRKNIYGFQLPGWNILNDDQMLYEIEHLFKEGLVATSMKTSGFKISDWHSNLHNASENSVTGYIELDKYAVGLNPDLRDNSVTISNIQTEKYRYFYSQLNQNINSLIKLNSESLILIHSLGLGHLTSELNLLDSAFGINKWTLLAHQKVLVLLVPELWTQEELNRFIGIGLSLRKKLS